MSVCVCARACVRVHVSLYVGTDVCVTKNKNYVPFVFCLTRYEKQSSDIRLLKDKVRPCIISPPYTCCAAA